MALKCVEVSQALSGASVLNQPDQETVLKKASVISYLK